MFKSKLTVTNNEGEIVHVKESRLPYTMNRIIDAEKDALLAWFDRAPDAVAFNVKTVTIEITTIKKA